MSDIPESEVQDHEIKSSSELGEILNLTAGRIRQLADKGVVFRADDGKGYKFFDSVTGYCRYMQENDSKRASTSKFQDARADKEQELALAAKRKRLIEERFYISREEYAKGLDAAMHIQSREFTVLLNKFQRLVPGISNSLLKAIEAAMVKSHNAICALQLKHEAEEEIK